MKATYIVNQTRFGCAAELESTLRNYVKIYNHSIPQRALQHQTPIQALKKWQQEKPGLFLKRVYNQAGLDTRDARRGRLRPTERTVHLIPFIEFPPEQLQQRLFESH